ncbi:2-dehydropantoate 2-reductase [Botryosphaeria dothidea]|uniref:2-dehydropantoate 2-reductase n=1 Tax=Botryosphaeria dothidea TaxID=55169 RepID=A0A8H4IPW8_9PEZI|nr:2-dehydropantoate 2-reductase [Botryosphaeria dothidea]KAF4305056.1 2-dehydropantoate 2-reductase [Botryosphaeria dothidea]
MTVQKPLDILIFGTGAVGSTLGWRLAQNPNARLSVVCRSNYEAVKRRGIQLTTKMWGNGQFTPYRVIRSTREVSDMSFDYVVCANKVTSSDGFSFIKELGPAVSKNTTLVSAQNGVGVEAPLRSVFRNNTILSAVCYISCLQPVPGIIQQVSNIRPHAFHVGTYDPRDSGAAEVDSLKLEKFVALDDKFKQIGDVQAERWTKQIFNGAWNPMTAISGLETHPLLESPYVQTVLQLATEIYEVAVNLEISLSDDLPVQTIEFARNNPSLAPSMLQDARKNRPMEVESLCGNICRLADQNGVPVPTIKLVYHTLLEMNRRIMAPELSLASRTEHIVKRNRSVAQEITVRRAVEAAAAAC